MFKYFITLLMLFPSYAVPQENNNSDVAVICNQLTLVYINTLTSLKNKDDYTDILFFYSVEMKDENEDYLYLVFDTVRTAAKSNYEKDDFKKLTDTFKKECMLKVKIEVEDTPRIII